MLLRLTGIFHTKVETTRYHVPIYTTLVYRFINEVSVWSRPLHLDTKGHRLRSEVLDSPPNMSINGARYPGDTLNNTSVVAETNIVTIYFRLTWNIPF